MWRARVIRKSLVTVKIRVAGLFWARKKYYTLPPKKNYNESTSVWETCARTEGEVSMYFSKQSEVHQPKALMSPGGKLAEAAVVDAPILKLWPAYFLESLRVWVGLTVVIAVNWSTFG